MLPSPSRALAALALTSCLALAACGDDDDAGSGSGSGSGGGAEAAEVRETITKYANARDGKVGCPLLTQRLLEEQTGRKGAAAVTFCEQNFSSEESGDVKIGRPTVTGDRATLTATAGGDTARFTLLRAGGGWKIDDFAEVGDDEDTATTAQTTTAPAAPSKDEFVADVNEICKSSEAQFARVRKAIDAATEPAQVQRAVADLAQMFTGVVTRMAAVTPPAGDEQAVRAMTTAMSELATASTQLGAAVASGRADDATRAGDQAEAKAKAFEKQAKAYGIEPTGACRPDQ